MKRINEYKKLFNVDNNTDLKVLKKTYRNLVKEWHPDKFQDDDEKKLIADEMGRKVIDGYHFLVSINPETIKANLEEYTNTITTTQIADFHHKGQVLELVFTDGSTYEYFGVSKPLFQKFVNTDKQLRFAKRNFFNGLTYRKSKRDAVVS
jgi:hypothetical protein